MVTRVDDMRIDDRVRYLVKTLAVLPGIVGPSIGRETSVSNHRRGRPADEFCVDFDVDVLAGGWRSLNILVFATRETDSLEHLSVTAWPNADEPTDCLSFKLRGSKSADPDELANAIERVLEGDFSGDDEPSRQQGG
jgi:hypothetical protein